MAIIVGIGLIQISKKEVDTQDNDQGNRFPNGLYDYQISLSLISSCGGNCKTKFIRLSLIYLKMYDRESQMNVS